MFTREAKKVKAYTLLCGSVGQGRVSDTSGHVFDLSTGDYDYQ